jgi:myo-inositol 2-dehydrogenase/D-chiro-inositol 1-dehydrogenase
MDIKLSGVPKSAVVENQQNWIACIKSNSAPNASVEIAHRTATAAHLGNIAVRMGRTIHFNPSGERIIGDDEAAAFLTRKYRDGGHWGIPAGI